MSTPPSPSPKLPTKLEAIFGRDFAPWVLGGLFLGVISTGCVCVSEASKAGSPAAGAIAAVGAFFAGVGALWVLLQRG